MQKSAGFFINRKLAGPYITCYNYKVNAKKLIIAFR